MLFSIEKANNINRKFIWIGERLEKIFFGVKYDLARTGIEISAEKYLTAAFLSALAYGTFFFFLFFTILFLKDKAVTPANSAIAGAIALGFFSGFFFLHMVYPRIMAKQFAAGIDQSLLFALKSMLIQVSSGVSLFDSMVNVSRSNYGTVSGEFETVVREISAGESEAKALEKLALRTKSEYLKKTSWQMLTSIRSGSSLEGALSGVVEMLSSTQLRSIKNYAAELNFWILMYLLLAAALPTLGITFTVILSTLGGTPTGPEHIITLIAMAVVLQVVLMGFIRTRIPKVY